jgi:hypothetical protein
LYSELLPLLTGHRVELLDLPWLHAQLLGLERRTARGGRDSIDHGPGAHDDVANAVAGACVLVTGERVTGAGWLRFCREETERMRAEQAARATTVSPWR